MSWKQTAAARAILSREIGAIHKDHGGKLTVALAYPNTYRIGMSSLALQILYRAFNSYPDVVCERVFWDAAAAASGLPLVSLESQTPVAEFDVLAFTVSFEMDYFNLVAMLRQAGIEPLRASRHAGDEGRRPLLLAGGPALTMNPEPLAPFFDAIVFGEAEELLPHLIEALKDSASIGGATGSSPQQAVGGSQDPASRPLLEILDGLPGVYVPSRLMPTAHGWPRKIERLWVADMSRLEPVSCLYTPDAEFASMHLIEIARGCGRGCRFCLAGYVYRPPRQQPLERILGWAREGLARRVPVFAHGGKTGERSPAIGLVSAAVSDHTQIGALAQHLRALGARLSVSSMRADPISAPLLQALATSGAQTLTLAPEAGTARLRRAINKNQTEDDLLAAVELAQGLNFPQLKLYFMVGHPTEGDEDIQGIVDLTLRAKAIFRRKVAINATPYVPKPQTPFQGVAMAPAKTLQARQNALKRALARHAIAVDADSPQWAEVQGVLARGDRRLAPVLADAEWNVLLRGPLTVRDFHAALARHGLTAGEFLGPRDPAAAGWGSVHPNAEFSLRGEVLPWQPWDVVESGVTQEFLRREGRLAQQERPGFRCPPGSTTCAACGVCAPSPAGGLGLPLGHGVPAAAIGEKGVM